MRKFGIGDARDILERASTRETAARVAAGALATLILHEAGVEIVGYVRGIGPICIDPPDLVPADLRRARDASETYCPDPAATKRMKQEIDAARQAGNTLGGLIEMLAVGLPVGLGGHAQWRDKLDARLARAVMSVQAIKSVEIGMGRDVAAARGSDVHDEIVPGQGGEAVRPTNRAGGIEGGMTNGAPVVVRAAMKPIPTLMRPLRTIDVATGQPADACKERSDVCAAPAASVVVQSAVAFELAAAVIERFGAATLAELKARTGGR
jgi:chorismate synthase